MKTYEFRFQNRKGLIYILIGVLQMPLVILLFKDIPINWSLFVMFSLFIACFVIGIIKSNLKESIQMDEHGFDSKTYGRINFQDITDVGLTNSIWSSPLGLVLVLSNGKKFRWIINVTADQLETNTNAIVFNTFLQDLQKKLDKVYVRDSPNQNDLIVSNIGVQKPLVTPLSEKLYNPAEQLKQESQKRNSSKKWTIPISLGFALLALARACGPEIAQKFRHDPDFSEIYRSTKKDESKKIYLARVKANEILKKFGKIYLLTNDSVATLEALPNINDKNTPLTGSDVLNTISLSSELDKYIANPDSLGIAVLLKSGTSVKEISFDYNQYGLSMDSAHYPNVPWVTFIAQDTTLHIIPSYERIEERKDSSEYPNFYYQSTFTIDPKRIMSENMKYAAPGMKMMFSNAHFRPSFKLYFILSEKQGFSSEDASKNIAAIKKVLHSNKLDSAQFIVKSWN